MKGNDESWTGRKRCRESGERERESKGRERDAERFRCARSQI